MPELHLDFLPGDYTLWFWTPDGRARNSTRSYMPRTRQNGTAAQLPLNNSQSNQLKYRDGINPGEIR